MEESYKQSSNKNWGNGGWGSSGIERNSDLCRTLILKIDSPALIMLPVSQETTIDSS